MIGKGTMVDGNLGSARAKYQGESEIAKGREQFWNVARAKSGAILLQRDIADAMRIILGARQEEAFPFA
jgi:hypothetical protein